MIHTDCQSSSDLQRALHFVFLLCIGGGTQHDGPSVSSDLGWSRLHGPGSAESAAPSVLLFLLAAG